MPDESKIKELTESEKDRLQNVFETIQNDVIIANGLSKISGAFCQTKVWDYSDDVIDVEVKWGIQDGDDNVVYTDHVELDRATMKPLDVVERVARSMSPGR